MPRPIYDIAKDIMRDWPRSKRGAAQPYLSAMVDLSSINENYFNDSAKSIVLYFLSNAGTWRGEVARRIKAELKEMVK